MRGGSIPGLPGGKITGRYRGAFEFVLRVASKIGSKYVPCDIGDIFILNMIRCLSEIKYH